MKGQGLPISTIVIVVLCLIVLIAVAAILLGVWNPFKNSVSLETAKDNACQMLVSMGCSQSTNQIPVRDFDANRNGTIDSGQGKLSSTWDIGKDCFSGENSANSGDNLATLCLCYYNLYSDSDCATKLCGCGTGTSGTGGGGSNTFTCSDDNSCCLYKGGPCTSDQKAYCNPSNTCICGGTSGTDCPPNTP